MSVISGNLTMSSILKSNKTTINERMTKTPSKVRFQLPHTQNIFSILENYSNRSNVKAYFDLVNVINDSDLSDEELRSLLSETSHCILLLTEDLKHFVEAILKIKWAHRSKMTVRAYQTFLFELLSAHNYYVNVAIRNLVGNFLPDPSQEVWENGIPSDEEYKKYVNVHYVINILLKIIPMSAEFVVKSLIINYPYYKKPAHQHEVYLHNLLWVLDYRPEFKMEILSLIIKKLILLDTNAPRDTIENDEDEEMDDDNGGVFSMDTDTINQKTMQNPIANTLDICLDRMFIYLTTECHDPDTGQINWEKTRTMYNDISSLFEGIIMATYDSHHVQFIMFYLCSFKVQLAEGFISLLWKKISNLSLAVVHRQSAVAYLASFLARAAYISLGTLQTSIKLISDWLHSYIGNQDGLESMHADARVHTVFYSVCQALFYVVAFRHKDLIQSRKSLTFLQSLNLSKIVTCRLNPLRFCVQPVVQNFAAITRTYQLVYCYAIIEHNARNSQKIMYRDRNGQLTKMNVCLQSFFPFDPYLLVRSKQKIEPLYVEYQELPDGQLNVTNAENHTSSKVIDEDDDFLVEGKNAKTNVKSTNIYDFSYSTSPGFKSPMML
ncbi:RNA polymerase I-specific transcription initiation factor RRN3 [Chrysoperla carnea]|uniref:RNA polymerase I-specific transcription initiation factor RRN3 n=1 Tax=Chrysoperla carnea TaxID=189513 RepID=UPI001D087C31|nr:RNA polymerase I-specific transcription initiation factor RRN3 [Chrysoperla carnea]